MVFGLKFNTNIGAISALKKNKMPSNRTIDLSGGFGNYAVFLLFINEVSFISSLIHYGSDHTNNKTTHSQHPNITP